MQVYHSNFDIVADEFLRLLDTCEFYAMDQEMTGINVGNGRENYSFTPSLSYSGKRNAATVYTAFQVGICLFHKSASVPGTYEARPFNFWLRQRGDKAQDVNLNFSSIDFLLQNHMNFQTWLESGITYVTAAREAEERAKFFQTQPHNLSEAEVAWKNKKVDEIKAFLQGDSSKTTLVYDNDHVSVKADLALHFDIAAQELYVAADPPLHTYFPVWKRTTTTITRQTKQEFDAAAAADHARRTKLFHGKIGFRRLFTALCNAKTIPMIGHNFSSDLLFWMNQHEGDLPVFYSDIKDYVHNAFARIYDTKVLSQVLPEAPFLSTSLEPLFSELQSQRRIDVQFPIGFESYAPDVIARAGPNGGGVAHQGAYDAYMTGVVYLHFLQRNSTEEVKYLENRIAVFGSCFFWTLRPGERDTLSYCTPIHLSFRSNTTMDDIDNFMMTSEQLELKREASKDKKRLRATRPYTTHFCDDSNAVITFHPPLPTPALEELMARLKAKETDDCKISFELLIEKHKDTVFDELRCPVVAERGEAPLKRARGEGQ